MNKVAVSSWSDLADRTSASEATISVTTNPQPPCRFTIRRKTVSVSAAMGASAVGAEMR